MLGWGVFLSASTDQSQSAFPSRLPVRPQTEPLSDNAQPNNDNGFRGGHKSAAKLAGDVGGYQMLQSDQ